MCSHAPQSKFKKYIFEFATSYDRKKFEMVGVAGFEPA